MTSTRIFYPENRLAPIIGDGRDATGDALEKAAESRVAALKDSILAYVALQLSVFSELARAADEDLFAECRRLESAALGICEVAGAAGLSDMGEAARGVNAMISALTTHGVWHTDALRLHMHAVAMFATEPAPSGEEAKKILSRLQTMRDRFGVVS